MTAGKGLYISEPEPRERGAILISDEDSNDIAEFFHNEHATVEQSYETALGLAQRLVGSLAERRPFASDEPCDANQAWHELVEKDDRTSPEDYPDMALITFEELQDFMTRSRSPAAKESEKHKIVELIHEHVGFEVLLAIESGVLTGVENAADAILAALGSRTQPESVANVKSPQPRVTDNDGGEITVSLNGHALRGWSYSDDAERRMKMLAAREYVEGWCDGRKQ